MNTQMIHPMLVHFPIALILVGFLFSTIAVIWGRSSKSPRKGAVRTGASSAHGAAKAGASCCGVDSERLWCVEKCGFWMLGLGAISALVALCSGYVFTNAMPGVTGEIRTTHASFALMSMVVAMIAAGIYAYYIYGRKRNEQVKFIGYILYAVAVVLIAITGHLGGSMVF